VNDGYFWRMPPSDAIQAKVLAKLVEEDNVTSVNMIVVNNAYGNALAAVFQASFDGTVGKVERFAEQGTTSYSSQVDAACATPTPQAIVLVVYTEAGAAILKEMQAKGCLSKVKIYASEGVYDQDATIAKQADKDPSGKWLAAGLKGTTPSAGDTSGYTAMFQAEYGHAPLLYSPESYDGVMYLALAALKAQSTDGRDIRNHLQSIANGPGPKVSNFAQAADMILAGQDIDWVGQAHDFDFNSKHEPDSGVYAYWEIKSDGTMMTTREGVTA
jgi:branched-chain amino acid transport system substrate-binding protein